jgi:hypothetical protein
VIEAASVEGHDLHCFLLSGDGFLFSTSSEIPLLAMRRVSPDAIGPRALEETKTLREFNRAD